LADGHPVKAAAAGSRPQFPGTDQLRNSVGRFILSRSSEPVMSGPSHTPGRRRAFTIIDLPGVIAFMIGLLVPAFQKVCLAATDGLRRWRRVTRFGALGFFVLALAVGPTCSLMHAAEPSPLAWPTDTSGARPWTRWWWLGSAVDKPNLTR